MLGSRRTAPLPLVIFPLSGTGKGPGSGSAPPGPPSLVTRPQQRGRGPVRLPARCHGDNTPAPPPPRLYGQTANTERRPHFRPPARPPPIAHAQRPQRREGGRGRGRRMRSAAPALAEASGAGPVSGGGAGPGPPPPAPGPGPAPRPGRYGAGRPRPRPLTGPGAGLGSLPGPFRPPRGGKGAAAAPVALPWPLPGPAAAWVRAARRHRAPPGMAEQKRLAYAIVRFLHEQLRGGGMSPDAQESLEVAIQCLETAFGVSLDDKDLAVSQTLPEIFEAAVGKVSKSPEHALTFDPGSPRGELCLFSAV
uniref:SGTA homodimerisation domain-containing protein n=1 Tax=Anas platyrhynchos platyrhynchos TaxID=8840 RepID=A0A493T494_ANAPP